eukprot:2539695-Pleurochrysis_carterae.AAC.1
MPMCHTHAPYPRAIPTRLTLRAIPTCHTHVPYPRSIPTFHTHAPSLRAISTCRLYAPPSHPLTWHDTLSLARQPARGR